MSWQKDLTEARCKTPGWYGCSVPEGWKNVVEETNRLLAELDPFYEIMQIKEKFGALRYYYHSNANATTQELMKIVVDYAELWSVRTCEVCGSCSLKSNPSKGIEWDSTAVLKSTEGGWFKTICDTCDADGRYYTISNIGIREQYADLEYYAKEARQKALEGQDLLDVFLAIAKKDMLNE